MLTEEQKKALNANLPSEAVKSRKGAGKSLSYCEGWWVMDRLNAILGPGGWSYDATDTTEAVRELRTNEEGKERWHVTYRAKCRLRVGDATYGDVGTGHGIDRDLGAAIESAEKEAATDAFKRCAKSLGRHLGLALYDKTQEHVGFDASPILHAMESAATEADFAAATRLYRQNAGKLSGPDEERIIAAGKAARERITPKKEK